MTSKEKLNKKKKWVSDKKQIKMKGKNMRLKN